MSDTAAKNGLEVVTIEGATSVGFGARSIGSKELPDGRLRRQISDVPTSEGLPKFEQVHRDEIASGNSVYMLLSVSLPDRKPGDGLGFIELSGSVCSRKPEIKLKPGERIADYFERNPEEKYGPDIFRVELDGATLGGTAADGTEIIRITGLANTIHCILYAVEDAIFADVDGLAFVVRNADKGTLAIIARRNKIAGIETPARLAKWAKANRLPEKERTPIDTADAFPYYTSQEMDILNRAQCDGKTYTRYFANDQAGMIAYERKGATHSIRLALTEDERAGGLTMNYLENLVRAQDADAVIATAYILGVLAPPAPLPARAAAIGWIDFNDVIKKIGWNPQTTKARREMHGRLWDFIKYGERAHIVGKRSIKYKDAEHNEIDTTIHGAAWRVMKTETPDSEPNGTPVSVEIAVSRELTALITHPKTTQYLPMAEVLGAIPGGQPSGAWARVIGVALMAFWRCNPRETISGTIQPTRRELLDHFTAKVNPYNEVLESNNPARVIDYWCDALQILADGGFIERTGEAAITAKQMRAALPRQNWQRQWLDQTVNIEPGAATLKPAIEERTKALPAAKARDLKKKPRAKKLAKI